LQGKLVHVYPANESADPIGLLDVRLRLFSMPQDSCLRQAIENIDEGLRGYAPELTNYPSGRAPTCLVSEPWPGGSGACRGHSG
jgi:hypothetical protein